MWAMVPRTFGIIFPRAVYRDTSGYVCWQVLWDGYTYLGSPGDFTVYRGVLACLYICVLDWAAVLASRLNKCEFYNRNKPDLIRQKCCGAFCWFSIKDGACVYTVCVYVCGGVCAARVCLHAPHVDYTAVLASRLHRRDKHNGNQKRFNWIKLQF